MIPHKPFCGSCQNVARPQSWGPTSESAGETRNLTTLPNQRIATAPNADSKKRFRTDLDMRSMAIQLRSSDSNHRKAPSWRDGTRAPAFTSIVSSPARTAKSIARSTWLRAPRCSNPGTLCLVEHSSDLGGIKPPLLRASATNVSSDRGPATSNEQPLAGRQAINQHQGPNSYCTIASGSERTGQLIAIE